ncbi:MAG: SIMPL domain-containing protein [Rhodobacteraceae bacterium]|nr:SIMPL domain-containing protein [Paracoccaceae bacterium]
MRLILFLISIVSICAPAWADTHAASPRISVVGEGRAAAIPDMASISFGVATRAKDAGAAMSATSAKIEAVIVTLQGYGLERRDVQTSSLSVTTVYETRPSGQAQPAIAGYEARNTLTVRVRDLDILGDVLDAVLSAGVNEMYGLQFGLQDPEPVLEKARRNAVADAQRRASAFADAAGLTLGAVLTMTEAGASSPRFEVAAMSARASSVPVAEGEAEMIARITIVYDLTP